jgi:integrase
MTTETRSRNPFLATDQPTLADVIARLEADEILAPTRRREMISALNGLARIFGRDPRGVPAHTRFLRERMKDVAPAAHGISAARWANVRSLVTAALQHLGLALLPGRYTAPLTAAWQELWDALPPGKGLRCRLSRLLHYCSANSIDPGAVDDTLLDRFGTALANESLVRYPREIHRIAILGWNVAAVDIPAWPQRQLTPLASARAQGYILPWSAFPASFVIDVEAYVKRLAGQDLLLSDDDLVRPVRPDTVYRRRLQLRRIASAAVAAGAPPDSIASLADLVSVDTTRVALTFLWERAGRKPTAQLRDLAALTKAVARHWVRADAAHLEKLAAMARKVTPRHAGMTQTNRERLRPFDDPRHVSALLALPERVVREVQRNDKGLQREALLVQTALAVEILLMAPIRIANLANLSLDRHIVRSGSGKDAVVHLVLEPEEVKNDRSLEYPLPQETVALLDLYCERYRPRLAQAPHAFLFPGRGAKPKNPGPLGDQIRKLVKRRLGFTLNPHLFRHAGAKFYLDQNPGAYALMSRVLGHRSVDTTTNYYTGFESAAAVRQFNTVILGLRDGKDTAPSSSPAITSRRQRKRVR